MARFFGAIFIFLFILAALVGGLIVGMPMIPLERLAPQIERASSQFLGRSVHIDGQLRLNALPSPRLRASNVRIDNWAGGLDQNMASVEALDFIIQLPPLLNQEVHIERLVANQPQISLEMRPDGSANWQFDIQRSAAAETTNSGQGGGFELKDLKLAGLEITDATASFLPAEGPAIVVENINIQAQLGGLDEQLSAQLSATWEGRNLGFNGALNSLNDVLQGRSFQVDGLASLNQHRAQAQGVVDMAGGFALQGMQLDASGPSVLELLDLAEVQAPVSPDRLGAYSLSGVLDYSNQTAQLQGVDIGLHDVSVQGDVLANFSNGLFVQSLAPVVISVGDTNGWLQSLDQPPLPNAPQLFGPLRLQGDVALTQNAVDLLGVQLSLGDIQVGGSFFTRFEEGNLRLETTEPLQIAGPSVDLIARTFDIELPRVQNDVWGAFNINSDVALNGQQIRLSNFQGTVDQISAFGDVAVDLGQTPLAFDASLITGPVDTRPYFALSKNDPSQRKATAARDPNNPWGRTPLAFDFLGLAQGSASLEIQSLTTGMVDLGQTRARANWQNSAISAEFEGNQLYNGQANGRVALSNRGGVSGLATDLSLQGVDAGRVLADLLGVDQIEGVTSLDIALNTQGGVVQDWMNQANGRFNAVLNPLGFIGLDLLGSINNLSSGQFEPLRGPQHKTQFNQVRLTGIIQNGVAIPEDLNTDLGGVDFLGSGSVNIGAQTLDYKFETLINNEIPLPIIIQGSWLDPQVLIDSNRLLEFALANPQMFIDLLPAEWQGAINGLLPEGYSLGSIQDEANNIAAQAQALFEQEQARLQAAAEAEAARVAAQLQAEADRLAQQAADQAAAFAQQQAQALANQLGEQAGSQVQGLVDQGIEQLGQSGVGQQLQDQALDAAGQAVGNLFGNLF